MKKNTSSITFSKMHGLGNDFVVIDAINQTLDIHALPIKHLADRHLGIGFDQLLLVGPATNADFSCQIFNADGSEAEQCGNGMRCVGRFIFETGLSKKKQFSLATKAGLIEIAIHDFDTIRVNMNKPCFTPALIPFLSNQVGPSHTLKVAGQALEAFVVSLGNPHTVIIVENIETAPVATLGVTLATDVNFPQGTNVGFMQIISPEHILLRTYERGVGETFACGSNACAAAVAGITKKILHAPVTVELEYGKLQIDWDGKADSAIFLTGPATQVFTGTIKTN